MQKTAFFFITLIMMFSCNSKKIERENQPDIYNVESNDIEMNKAIENAKQTLDSFEIAFKNNSRVFTFFGLKKRFEENGIVEHIWIGNIKNVDGKFYGIVDNLPEKINNVKFGDTIKMKLVIGCILKIQNFMEDIRYVY